MTPTSAEIDQLWDYNRPDVSEQRFRELLPQAAELLPLEIELLTQIARAQGLQRQFAAAHATLDRAQQQLTPEMTRPQIRYLLERGRVFNSAGLADQASAFFEQAWELARAAGESFYAIDAAHMLGISEPPERQLRWSLQALELAEQASDPRAQAWRGPLLNNIGWSYHDQGQYEQALHYLQRALAWREAAGSAPEIAIARWGVARALRALGRVAEALAIQQTLLGETESADTPDGYVYEELAECLLLLGRTDEALPYFALAYAQLALDPWLSEHEPQRLARLKQLGGV